MPFSLFIKPVARADFPVSSGTLGLGAEIKAPLQSQCCYVKGYIHIRFITAFSTLKQLSFSVKEHSISLARITTLRTSLRGFCSWNFNNINFATLQIELQS